MSNFVLIGAAGYIAPRHLNAIKETGNNLLAVMDPHDSVGILDSFFPQAAYFSEFERFDRHIDKLIRKGQKIDYVSVCSPNYLHDSHIRFGLRIGANVICEKPLVIKPDNCEILIDKEKESKNKVYTVLQLRHHPLVIDLKNKIEKSDKRHIVHLSYLTARGPWYEYSWKGDITKSGGLAMNIGIHFFDMLVWIFGPLQSYKLYEKNVDYISGNLSLEKADVDWILSTRYDKIPNDIIEQGNTTYKKITVDNVEIDLSGGFTTLHDTVYQSILDGKGYGIKDSYPSLALSYDIMKDVLRGK